MYFDFYFFFHTFVFVGINKQMWQAAIQDNPDTKKYVPVVINGFSDLKCRMLQQEFQTGLHQAFLEKVNKDITVLKTSHSTSLAKITELKQTFLELQHRILRVGFLLILFNFTYIFCALLY